MDVIDALIWRLVGPVSPSLRARVLWSRRNDPGRPIVDATVRKGDVAIDVGANSGLYTDRLARLVGREGAVYAFEPNPRCTRELRRIAASRGNVSVIVAAASDRHGSATLSVPKEAGRPNDAMGTIELRGGSASETFEVKTTTLDSELANVTGVRFLKCDVEGHEHEVIAGGRALLERERPVILVELEQRHRSRPLADTFTLLEELGYRGLMLTAAGPKPLADFDLERDQIAPLAADLRRRYPPKDYVNTFVFTTGSAPARTPEP